MTSKTFETSCRMAGAMVLTSLFLAGTAGAASQSSTTNRQLVGAHSVRSTEVAGHAPHAGSLSADELTEWARRYEQGDGVPQDYALAVRFYCRAADEAAPQAKYALGWMYVNGRGVEQDHALAAAWFRRAAKAGDPFAEQMLSLLGDVDEDRAAECRLPTGAVWQPIPPSMPNPDEKTVSRWVRHFAPLYGLSAELVMAVIRTESNFRYKAVSPKNAKGLMQLIPATAKRFGVKNPLDPVDNIRGGMAYLKWLLRYFKGDVKLALAGYNAGERAVKRYAGIPPYGETRAYVKRVLKGLDRGRSG